MRQSEKGKRRGRREAKGRRRAKEGERSTFFHLITREIVSDVFHLPRQIHRSLKGRVISFPSVSFEVDFLIASDRMDWLTLALI